jgi:sugar lactone lactonase YvrE
MQAQNLNIKAVTPAMGVPGGEVTVYCEGFRPGLPGESKVVLGDVEASIISASEQMIVARLPDSPASLGVSLTVNSTVSPLFPFALASQLVTGIHAVTSPVIAPDGAILTTVSGSRGQQVPNPIVRVTRSGEKTGLAADVMNPTGLAFGPDGQLYISSRNDGTVLRYRDYEQLEVVADDLGIACGIAFDSKGLLYVGDRAGKILRLDLNGEREEYAQLEPSVSAYHLVIDREDRLYVTGPTLSMRDPLNVVPEKGRVETPVRGLARPQGMAVAANGDVLIACAYSGKKGIFLFSPASGSFEHFITAPMLVGVTVAEDDIFLAENTSLYWLRPRGGSAI